MQWNFIRESKEDLESTALDARSKHGESVALESGFCMASEFWLVPVADADSLLASLPRRHRLALPPRSSNSGRGPCKILGVTSVHRGPARWASKDLGWEEWMDGGRVGWCVGAMMDVLPCAMCEVWTLLSVLFLDCLDPFFFPCLLFFAFPPFLIPGHLVSFSSIHSRLIHLLFPVVARVLLPFIGSLLYTPTTASLSFNQSLKSQPIQQPSRLPLNRF